MRKNYASLTAASSRVHEVKYPEQFSTDIPPVGHRNIGAAFDNARRVPHQDAVAGDEQCCVVRSNGLRCWKPATYEDSYGFGYCGYWGHRPARNWIPIEFCQWCGRMGCAEDCGNDFVYAHGLIYKGLCRRCEICKEAEKAGIASIVPTCRMCNGGCFDGRYHSIYRNNRNRADDVVAFELCRECCRKMNVVASELERLTFCKMLINKIRRVKHGDQDKRRLAQVPERIACES